MHNLKYYFLFFIILSFGIFVRIFDLNRVPSGFFADEASIGYNAYSLLNTEKDEFGVSFPIFFQSFGDYRPPLAIYSAIPFVKIFGLNEMSTRLPSAFYGVVTIITVYFIGKELSSNRKPYLGLLSALIAATMPWLIHYNRTGFEFTIYVTFFTITIFLLLKSIKDKSFIIPAFIVAAITFYTYQPAKLLIPLLLLGFLFIYKKIYLLHAKNTAIGLLSFLIISIPIILSFFNGQGLARFSMVSVFSAKLAPTQTILRVIHNYFIQSSPSYFISGEPTFITRHFIGGLTPLLIVTFPFLFVGIIYSLLTIKGKRTSRLFIYWLFIYPIAGAVTADAPFTSRSIIGTPLFAVLISIGIIKTIEFLPIKKFATAIILFLIIGNFLFFLRFYFFLYPLYSSDFWGWQYGARDIVEYFVANESNYDQLIMAPEFNSPEIFFKFYAPNNCKNCSVGTPHDAYNLRLKQLFAVTPAFLDANPSINFFTQKFIYYPNKKIAFQIGEVVK